MALERTFSIIKPDATRRNITGKVAAVLEEAGLRIVAQKRVRMSQAQAESFYGVHKERPFFNGLVKLHDLGPGRRAGAGGRGRHRAQPQDDGCDRPEAKADARHDPQALFAEDIEANTVHGSDSPETAKRHEIAFFFTDAEIVG